MIGLKLLRHECLQQELHNEHENVIVYKREANNVKEEEEEETHENSSLRLSQEDPQA